MIGKAKDVITGVPIVGDTLGSVADEIKSSVSQKLAGGDKVLFKGFDVGSFAIEGKGSTDGDQAGNYKISFETV